MPGSLNETVLVREWTSLKVAEPGGVGVAFKDHVVVRVLPVAAPLRVMLERIVWSMPASAVGAPAERGPSVAPVATTTSKLEMSQLSAPALVPRWSKAVAGQRSSGQIEIEKKLPLSATNAPYFFSPRAIACSAADQLAGTTKDDFKRSRWPIAGMFTSVVEPA